MKIIKIISIILLFAFGSCASVREDVRQEKKDEYIKEALTVNEVKDEEPVPYPVLPPEIPDFEPVRESSSLLDNKFVSITAKQTPLKDVLHIIAEVANLNIVMGKDVDPELPVSMTVKEISVEEALDVIFNSADYFYRIRNNILVVNAVETEIFELDQPNIIHDYSVDVGGDILSGTSSGAGEGAGAISGDLKMTSSSDSSSFKFWDALENSLKTLLSEETGGTGASGTNFVVNRMAGTIMVTGSKRDMKKVSDYITNLKKVLNRQVMVEARIVEVQLSDSLKYGIDWSAVGEWLGAGPMSISTNAFSDVITAGTPNFEMKIIDNDNIGFLLKALEQQGEVKTLSNPKVNIMNSQASMLSVGRNTTFISKVETSTTEGTTPVTSFTVETNSVLSGLIFGLVPYINSDGEITLTITPIITNLVDLEAKTVGVSNNSVEIKLPTVDLREMSTTVKVLDGQMVIIGGLIDKKESLDEQKVPLLGDIPLIGRAFRRVERTFDNTELVIMLIPRIVS